VTLEAEKELEALRSQIRAVTYEIMQKVHERSRLAGEVGEIKSRLGIDVKDQKVEQEIRKMVINQADEFGMDKGFALRLLNILLSESEAVQAKKYLHKTPQRQTHLGIFQKAKQLEASGKPMIHLEVGEPDYSPPQQAGNALVKAFEQRRYHYTDTRGIPQLREAIAKRNRVGEDHVIVTPGGRFAIFAAIASIVKPGEEIITIEPAWPAYKECADFIGARTRILTTTLEGGWSPDLREIESMITKGTKMIVLNYPNNPTGRILESKTVEAIVGLAKDYGLYLLSDEVYSDYSFKPFQSVNSFGYDKSIVVSSFSKTFAMTGFRVGYAIASSDSIKKMAKVQATGITSVAEPMQYAALAALGSDPSENADLMKKRLHFLSNKIKNMSLRFVEPDGAMYVYPELPRLGGSSDWDGNDVGGGGGGGEAEGAQDKEYSDIQLIERLLEKGLAIAPGSGFGDSYKRFVRISACASEEEMEKGLAILANEIGKA
jgi:aspartate aminotransferase